MYVSKETEYRLNGLNIDIANGIIQIAKTTHKYILANFFGILYAKKKEKKANIIRMIKSIIY